jgi:hypothetical protein
MAMETDCRSGQAFPKHLDFRTLVVGFMTGRALNVTMVVEREHRHKTKWVQGMTIRTGRELGAGIMGNDVDAYGMIIGEIGA